MVRKKEKHSLLKVIQRGWPFNLRRWGLKIGKHSLRPATEGPPWRRSRCSAIAWPREIHMVPRQKRLPVRMAHGSNPNGLFDVMNFRCLYWLVVWNMAFMIFHMLGISSSQLTNSYFSEGLKPATSFTWCERASACDKQTFYAVKTLSMMTSTDFNHVGFDW